jgi:hypothetical protein
VSTSAPSFTANNPEGSLNTISLYLYVYSARTCDLCFRGYRIAWVDPILGPTTKWIPGKLGGSRIYVNVVKDTGAPQKWMEKVKQIYD